MVIMSTFAASVFTTNAHSSCISWEHYLIVAWFYYDSSVLRSLL